MSDVWETHPSYGLLQIHRVSGHNKLFGSSINHNHFVTLSIYRAEVTHEHMDERYMDREQLIQVAMSAAQFAEAITTLNMGTGTPCTIERLDGKMVEDCPEVNRRQLVQDEFREKAGAIAAKFNKDVAAIRTILAKKSIGQADRDVIKGAIDQMVSRLYSDLPFFHTLFDEAMEKTMAHAKAEIEAMMTHAVQQAGMAAIRNEYEAKMIEHKE